MLAILNRRLLSGPFAELLNPPAGQISYLDGLRSMAVLLVISAHVSGQFAAVRGSNSFTRLPFVANGWIGVDLFFVLSGFFIGSQLWRELQDSGSIAVGRFVIRRGFRIWPLYFFTYSCLLTSHLASKHGLSANQCGWTDLLFISNFDDGGLILGGWSLCVEEQFYIIAPLTLFLLSGYFRKIRAARPWLWGLLLFIPLLRAIVWIHATGRFFSENRRVWDEVYFNSLTHCDGLIMGLIIANLWVARDKPASKLASPGVLILLAFVLMFGLHQVQKGVFDFSLLAFVFGSLVWLGLQRRIAIFDSRIVYWLSRLSFGMYLNHPYMCPWIGRSVLPSMSFSTRLPAVTNLIGVVITVALSAGMALVTFCFVEYPFLQLRKSVFGAHGRFPDLALRTRRS